MKRLTLCLALAVLPNMAPAETSYLLKPYDQRPGQVTTIQSTSTSSNGKVIIQQGAKKTEEAMSIQRSRIFERRIVSNGNSTGLSYKILKDISLTANELESKKQSKSTSPLTGKTAIGFKVSTERWLLYLEDQTATNRQAVELVELEAYANRRLFSPQAVKVGDSWQVDPAFIRHVVLRDLGDTKLTATMTLKSVQNIRGERTAVLSFKLDTVGVKGDSTSQSAATASIKATGTMLLSLDTMLDREFTIDGTLQTTAIQGDHTITAILPFNIRLTKAVAR
jgi:hypothetical protein